MTTHAPTQMQTCTSLTYSYASRAAAHASFASRGTVSKGSSCGYSAGLQAAAGAAASLSFDDLHTHSDGHASRCQAGCIPLLAPAIEVDQSDLLDLVGDRSLAPGCSKP
jgi:hypothetical protein